MSSIVQRLVVGTAVLISAGSFGYVIYRSTCESCGARKRPVVAASPELSEEGNRRRDRIVNTILAQSHLTEDDALFLEESIAASDEVVVQRWALAVMAAHLGKNSEMTAETRKVLEAGIVRRLWDTNPRIVICAIGCAEEAKLTERPDVRDRILALCDDGNPLVAQRASGSPVARSGG
ncbi:MAG: hypothetical protein ACF8R7_13645 [Phycisphaerales bacterium JB039]